MNLCDNEAVPMLAANWESLCIFLIQMLMIYRLSSCDDVDCSFSCWVFRTKSKPSRLSLVFYASLLSAVLVKINRDN